VLIGFVVVADVDKAAGSVAVVKVNVKDTFVAGVATVVVIGRGRPTEIIVAEVVDGQGWARDLFTRDRDETLIQVETRSRPRRGDREYVNNKLH